MVYIFAPEPFPHFSQRSRSMLSLLHESFAHLAHPVLSCKPLPTYIIYIPNQSQLQVFAASAGRPLPNSLHPQQPLPLQLPRTHVNRKLPSGFPSIVLRKPELFFVIRTTSPIQPHSFSQPQPQPQILFYFFQKQKNKK